jgi:hypothetical protein
VWTAWRGRRAVGGMTEAAPHAPNRADPCLGGYTLTEFDAAVARLRQSRGGSAARVAETPPEDTS